jgi:hypothetical protein
MLSSPVYLGSNHHTLPLLRLALGQPLFPDFHGERKPFRMNTYKSLSKQTTLTTIRMNTYKKPGGRVSSQLGSSWPVIRKKPARTVSSASGSGCLFPAMLEVDLSSELKHSRVEGRSDLAEIVGTESVTDLVKLGVIPGVEAFHAEFKPAATSLAEHEALEQ